MYSLITLHSFVLSFSMSFVFLFSLSLSLSLSLPIWDYHVMGCLLVFAHRSCQGGTETARPLLSKLKTGSSNVQCLVEGLVFFAP